jgi:hypothetical protein
MTTQLDGGNIRNDKVRTLQVRHKEGYHLNSLTHAVKSAFNLVYTEILRSLPHLVR